MNIERFKGSRYLAETIKDRLEELLELYCLVTVADYYELIGCTSTYHDSKMGWLSLEQAKIVMTDEPGVYELILPNPVPME
jgi:hypothetical protein